MKYYLYSKQELPENFSFPYSFLNIVNQDNVLDIEPWYFLYKFENFAKQWLLEMKKQYPSRSLIPFAVAHDLSGYYNDGYAILACFDGNNHSGRPKIYFHDYGDNSWGLREKNEISWEDRYCLASFDEWLKLAKEESAQYKVDIADSNED